MFPRQEGRSHDAEADRQGALSVADLPGDGTLPVCDLLKDHTGRLFPSLRKMAEHWGVPYAVFFSRFKKGWPLEAALTAPARRKRCFTDHKGNIFYSREDMLKYWGVPRWRYYQEAAADVPLREILETFGSKK